MAVNNKKTSFGNKIGEASHGAAAQSVTGKPPGCGFDSHLRR